MAEWKSSASETGHQAEVLSIKDGALSKTGSLRSFLSMVPGVRRGFLPMRMAQSVGWLLFCSTAACSPAKRQALAPEPARREPLSPPPIKRVDQWRFVDLNQRPTAVEAQLKRYFERLFPNAQYSVAYTCVARETVNFRERHAAMPDEELTRLISARCGAPTTGDFAITADLFSDGTILDSPLSAEALTDVSKQLMKELPPFTVFGITARYVGPNALVMLETASPKATVRADDPDSERRVHVAGRILANFNRARARINQGELGSVYCDVDAKADKKWPDYGFQCPLAVDDTEAWISIAADDGRGGSEEEVASLLAHEAGWVAPPEYQRERLRLPEQVDTGTALVMAINERRERLGRRQLTFAAEQSDVMRPSYDQTFALNAQGDWDGDYPYMVQMLRGDGVDGNVWWGRIVAGIAFDGDAADWLAVRLRLPMAREDLMSEGFDQVAITTHGDPSVGFGAAAGLYKLLTAERENALVEDLARNITKIRGKRPTERLENPRGIVELAHEVSAGRQPPSALDAALRRANLGRKDNQYLAALVLPLDSSNLDASTHFEPLRAEATLKYGIVVLHARSATYNWVDPFALVWYLTRRPAGQEAERPCRPDAAIATRSPD